MYHFIYKSYSTSGKFYIGRHSTDVIEDGYVGSGKWPRSCKKNGTILKRDILEFCEDFNQLKTKEKAYLDEHFDNPDCMNFHRSSVGFASGNLNPAKSDKERKRRSEKSWAKTNEGRKFLSENNPSKRDDIKQLRSEQLKSQWNDAAYRESKSGLNHHMHDDQHKQRMSTNNPMFSDVAKTAASLRAKAAAAEGKLGIQSIETRALLSEMRKVQVTCPHCNRTGGQISMKQHHFDRCKVKINNPINIL
jgi:hypothetical protein